MRKTIVFASIICLSLYSLGQNCLQQEIKIKYKNGIEVFNICRANPDFSFDESKEYFWYTDHSKIKSTKGGCGGYLLHGSYKSFDQRGNLRCERNFLHGLLNGNDIRWDSLGNIKEKSIYSQGDLVYLKFQDKDQFWIEHNGPIFKKGTVKKVFNKFGSIVEEVAWLEDFKQHWKFYYDWPENQLKEEYFTTGWLGKSMFGGYKAYYNNGQIKVEGQFYEGQLTNIRTGLWKWYNSDGSIEDKVTYKAEVLFWSNGEKKSEGSYFFNEISNEWEKTGEWKWYNESGEFLESKEY